MQNYMRYTIYIIHSCTYVVYTKPSFNILFGKVLGEVSSILNFVYLVICKTKSILKSETLTKYTKLP